MSDAQMLKTFIYMSEFVTWELVDRCSQWNCSSQQLHSPSKTMAASTPSLSGLGWDGRPPRPDRTVERPGEGGQTYRTENNNTTCLKKNAYFLHIISYHHISIIYHHISI